METIYKVTASSVEKVYDDKLIVRHIWTTEDRDRDDEILTFKGWVLDGYMKSGFGQFLWSHEHKKFPIGKVVDLLEFPRKKKRGADVAYPPAEVFETGNVAYRLVKWGALKDTSAGFLPFGPLEEAFVEGDPAKGDPIRTWVNKELVELSLCNVGSNPTVETLARDIRFFVRKEFKPKAMIEVPNLDWVKEYDAPAVSTTNTIDIETKPEPDVTENYIRIRVRDPGAFKDGSMRTYDIDKDKGIKSVMGKLKKPPEGQEGSMVIQSYLFDKEKWNTDDAQAWVEDHKGKGYNVIDFILDLKHDVEKSLEDFEARVANLEAEFTKAGHGPIGPGDHPAGGDAEGPRDRFARDVLDRLGSIAKDKSPITAESARKILSAMDDAKRKIERDRKRHKKKGG